VGRLDRRTPEGTTNIVLTLDRAEDAQGSLWIRVRIPALPNNTTGWVRRSTLGGYGVVRTRLLVDLSDRRLTLFRGGKEIFRAPIGIGAEEFPTPTGDFYVRNKLTRYRNAFYGPLAFGTSARSETLTDWPDGGFVGIHGTNQPELIPGRVSHGCIRLRNAAILRLGRLLPIGTPLRIRA
jgi:L,D-transpeptidase catalytic domain